MTVTHIGIDLAKSVFQLHGVDGAGNKVLTRRLRRDQLLPTLKAIPESTIGIEACTGAFYWQRQLSASATWFVSSRRNT